MLAYLRARAATPGVTNVQTVRAGLLTYEHIGAGADAVYTRDDLATHVRTEHSTYRWLLEPMLDAAGFEIIQTDFNRSVYGAYTCVKR